MPGLVQNNLQGKGKSPFKDKPEKVLKCEYCKQIITSNTPTFGTNKNACSEEFIAIAHPSLSLQGDNVDCDDDSDLNCQPQYKLTNFSIYDKCNHLCSIDWGLIEKNVELFFSGTLKPIYSEDPSTQDGYDVKDIGPINAWWITGFDGGATLLIGLTTAYADYYLMRPHLDYSNMWERMVEKMYLSKIVIEFLLEHQDGMNGQEASYADLVTAICTSVPPINRGIKSGFKSPNFTEESLLKHAQFIIEQVQSYDEFAETYDNLLILSPCLQTLIEFSGANLVKYSQKLSEYYEKGNSLLKYNQGGSYCRNNIINTKGRKRRLLCNKETIDNSDEDCDIIVRPRKKTKKMDKFMTHSNFAPWHQIAQKGIKEPEDQSSAVTPLVKSIFDSMFGESINDKPLDCNSKGKNSYTEITPLKQNNTNIEGTNAVFNRKVEIRHQSDGSVVLKGGLQLMSPPMIKHENKRKRGFSNTSMEVLSDDEESIEDEIDNNLMNAEMAPAKKPKNLGKCKETNTNTMLSTFMSQIADEDVIYVNSNHSENVNFLNYDFLLLNQLKGGDIEENDNYTRQVFSKLKAYDNKVDLTNDNINCNEEDSLKFEVNTGDFVIITSNQIDPNKDGLRKELDHFTLLRIVNISLLECLVKDSDAAAPSFITVHGVKYLRGSETILGETAKAEEILPICECCEDVPITDIYCKIANVQYMDQEGIVSTNEGSLPRKLFYRKMYDSTMARFQDVPQSFNLPFENGMKSDMTLQEYGQCPACLYIKNEDEWDTPVLGGQNGDLGTLRSEIENYVETNMGGWTNILAIGSTVAWRGDTYKLNEHAMIDPQYVCSEEISPKKPENKMENVEKLDKITHFEVDKPTEEEEISHYTALRKCYLREEMEKIDAVHHYLMTSNGVEKCHSKSTRNYGLRHQRESSIKKSDINNVWDLKCPNEMETTRQFGDIKSSPHGSTLGESEDLLYPELYRKKSIQTNGCIENGIGMYVSECPRPYLIAKIKAWVSVKKPILAAFQKDGTIDSALSEQKLYAICSRYFRPEETNTGINADSISHFDLLYWSRELIAVPHSAISVKCQVSFGNSEMDSEKEGGRTDLPGFYYVSGYDNNTKSIITLPLEAMMGGSKSKNNSKTKNKAEIKTKIEETRVEEKFLPLKCLDIFAGCGGLSQGFHDAGLCETVWAIENNLKAANAFRLNNPQTTVYTQSASHLLKLIMAGKKTNEIGQLLPVAGEVELLCGGPPCQGFSGMNRFNRGDDSKFKNSLIATMLSYCEIFKPKYFVLENVKNFLHFSNGSVLKLTLTCLVQMGYQCTFGLLQAGSYGIPQSRKRAFVMAARSGCILPKFPLPTHTFPLRTTTTSVIINGKKYINESTSVASAPYQRVTIRDSISDLPEIKNGSNQEIIPYLSIPQSHFQRLDKGDEAPKKFVPFVKPRFKLLPLVQNVINKDVLNVKLWQESMANLEDMRRPKGGESLDSAHIIKDHVCKEMSALVYARICHVPKIPGADWRDLPNITVELRDGTMAKKLMYTHNDKKNGKSASGLLRGVCQCSEGNKAKKCNPAHRQFDTLIPWCLPHTANRHNQWAGLYGRLAWDSFFSTTVTNPEPMGKQGRVLHPSQDRVVGVRECARSQGFKDSHLYYGTIVDKHRQIGNAVPPPLAKAIGAEIVKAILSKDAQQKPATII